MCQHFIMFSISFSFFFLIWRLKIKFEYVRHYIAPPVFAAKTFLLTCFCFNKSYSSAIAFEPLNNYSLIVFYYSVI